MDNDTLTYQDLQDLQQACTWAMLYWGKEADKKDEDADTCRLISQDYCDLWHKVEGILSKVSPDTTFPQAKVTA